jgi:uncharacterized protein (DUF433 family)
MAARKFVSIGRGVYTLAEAARLTRVPSRSIRRWCSGYTYRYKGEDRHSPAIIATEVEPIDGTPVLDFSDLIEVRFLNAFREHGVGWKAIRIAALRAMELLGRHRPFSTRIFKTDGRTILAEIVKETGDKVLLDLVLSQYAFERVLAPFLYAGLEFDDLDEPKRWWPLGTTRSVVLDPHRMFGAPIVTQGGVPTKILYDAVEVEQSIDFVAGWYEIEPYEVKDAVEFERDLAA